MEVENAGEMEIETAEALKADPFEIETNQHNPNNLNNNCVYVTLSHLVNMSLAHYQELVEDMNPEGDGLHPVEIYNLVSLTATKTGRTFQFIKFVVSLSVYGFKH